MHPYLVTTYARRPRNGDIEMAEPIEVWAEDAVAAIRSLKFFHHGGAMTHRLGGPEFQGHWQGDPAHGQYGVEAVHKDLDAEKIAALTAIKYHDDRREAAFHMIDATS